MQCQQHFWRESPTRLHQDQMLPELKNSDIPVFLRQPCGYQAVSHGLSKNASTEWHTKGERSREWGQPVAASKAQALWKVRKTNPHVMAEGGKGTSRTT